MDTVECSYSKLYDEASLENAYDALKDYCGTVVMPAILAYGNMSYVGMYENGAEHAADFAFGIEGYGRLLLAYGIKANGATSISGAFKLCSIEGESLKTVYSMPLPAPMKWRNTAVANINKQEYYSGYKLRIVKNADGTLKTIYRISDDAKENSITFSRDDRGNKYAFISYGGSACLYYDNDPSDTQYSTQKPAGCSLDGMAYRAKLPIMKGNTVTGLMDEPEAILNDSLGTNGANASFTLIDINGARYRQLLGGFWVRDND